MGNINNKESDLPDDQKNDVDLRLKMRVAPIETIFQAAPIESLSEFFVVDTLSDQTKMAAKYQYAMV